MNQIFSFKRYVWLLKRQWYEKATSYKWGIVLMVLVVGLLFWLPNDWKSVETPRLDQFKPFPLTAIFFLYIYGGWFFESLSSKHKKMFYFSLPVSPLERVTVAFTFVMILMPVLLLTVFNVFDFIFVHLFNHIHGTSVQMFFKTTSSKEMGSYLPYGGMALSFVMLLGYLSCTSAFTISSLIFGKKGPVVTIIFYLVFLFICFKLLILIFGVSSKLPSTGNSFADFINFFFYYTISPPVAIEYSKSNIFIYILPLMICWTAMYFVMKRKEA